MERGQHLRRVPHYGTLAAIRSHHGLVVLAAQEHARGCLNILLTQSHPVVAGESGNLSELRIVSRFGRTSELEVLNGLQYTVELSLVGLESLTLPIHQACITLLHLVCGA